MALSGKIVRRIALLIERHGHDPRPVFEEHGVDLDALDRARVSYSVVEAIGLRAAEITGVPNFGLELASTVAEPRFLDVAAWMLMASATVRQGLELAARHQNYWGDGERLTLAPAERGLAVRFAHSGSRRHDDECFLAEVVLGIRFMTGIDAAPRVVRFRHAAPGDTSQHASIFRCPIEFTTGRTELVLDDAVLDLRMKHAHELFQRMFEEEVARALRVIPAEARRLSSDVRDAARTAFADGALTIGELSVRRIAKTLGTSARTLQRRLRDEGTSFGGIVDAVRREMAGSLLDRGVPRKQVASILGYAEPSAFHRASKRWRELAGAQSQRTGARSS